MFNLYEANLRRLWVKYVFALGIILFFLIGSHLIHLTALSHTANDAKIINTAGQQRMLSQRIAFFAAKLNTPSALSEDSEITSSLTAAIKRFESNHYWLLKHALNSDASQQMYFTPNGPEVDRLTKWYIAEARKSISSSDNHPLEDVIVNLDKMANKPLLKKLDDAVSLFALESEVKVERLEFFQLASLGMAIVTLVAEAIFIFFPAQQGIIRSLKKVDDQNQDILKQNTKLVSLSHDLNHEINHDALTGLKNRRALKEELDVCVQGYRSGSQLFILMLDIDDFKEVNDTFGYPVGDLVLKYVAEQLNSLCRGEDVVARVGGDEFVIMIESSGLLSESRIHKLAEDIIAKLKVPTILQRNEISIGVSIGYAVAEKLPIEGSKLISDADIALRKSKSSGKGMALPYRAEMRDELEAHAKLLVDMMHAIENREFVSYLQPQVSLHDGHITGFEVLGRWNHPEKGVLPPSVFIPMAEEVGLVDQIDEIITSDGLETLAKLRAEGYNIPKISINMSALSLRAPNFCTDLTKSITEHDLLPNDVLIEVLETTLIEASSDQVVTTVTELSNAGYGIAIDDFGTGYSSLSMVVKLDISELKIDRSIVREMDKIKGRQALEAIILLAKQMNLTVVAEGIETASQFNTLKGLGCDIAQGFKIGRPMSLDQTRRWINSYGKSVSDGSMLAFENLS